MSKIENLVKNRNFGQKSKFWSKIEILVKNRKFGQKVKIWAKIENLSKNRNFGEKLKIWSKIETLSNSSVLVVKLYNPLNQIFHENNNFCYQIKCHFFLKFFNLPDGKLDLQTKC